MSPAPGKQFGPYEVLAKIGAGGMGEVWARDTRLDRTVAIKTSQAKFSDRFAREARAIAALNHPHNLPDLQRGADYLVMELVDGAPLLQFRPRWGCQRYEAGQQGCRYRAFSDFTFWRHSAASDSFPQL